MPDNSFFNEQTPQSLVKATITTKYFNAWAKIIVSTQKKYPQYTQKIAYIDLFAGPGRYVNGSQSTPIMVLNNAIQDNDLRERLVTLFNDMDTANSQDLEKAIKELSGIDSLKNFPQVMNQEVGTEIVKMFETMHMIPTLFFVDPWGYKGLSLRLIDSVIKDWGCDCIFFFNYNRINAGVNNPAVREHIHALFGEDIANNLREQIKDVVPQQREVFVIEAICQAIKMLGPRYVLPFRFKDARGTRTSHHLIFVSKHIKGYMLMKEIMYKESTSHNEGVASFEYNPRNLVSKDQKLLFKLASPLSELKTNLLDIYRGRTIGFIELYEEHSIDRPFVVKNYKMVLNELSKASIICARGKDGKPPKGDTFADHMTITFPSQGGCHDQNED
jgi:three-Cys-motif partner protein